LNNLSTFRKGANEMKTIITTCRGYDVIYWNMPNQATTLQIYKSEQKVYGALVQSGTALETAVRKIVELTKEV
jgi:hypothetical protein